MAVPVFGPIPLDEAPDNPPPAVATARPCRSQATPRPGSKPAAQPSSPSPAPVKVLIITGDHGHDWKATTRSLRRSSRAGGKFKVDVTTTPAKDLTDDNLAKYDVLLLNYKDTPNGPPETRWSDANKQAFLKAVQRGQGAGGLPSSPRAAFTKPNWEEFEKAIAGGWRSAGLPRARSTSSR